MKRIYTGISVLHLQCGKERDDSAISWQTLSEGLDEQRFCSDGTHKVIQGDLHKDRYQKLKKTTPNSVHLSILIDVKLFEHDFH